ncbi:MAG: inosine guanosine and xanthosine phosphorylase family [Segetibacter sp.]|jgi:purine-nucleoside phosphorylase|nr:inosine guanosine and xanthosine phosphorylase family [Segetibacter sp.]
MENLLEKISEAATFLKDNGFGDAKVGVVLGTGLGAFVNRVNDKKVVSYNHIPHFPVATVEFHKGQLITGFIGSVKVVVMQGRFHYYEGYTMQQITFPIRVMKQLGIEQLLLSNAAGGINLDFKKGALVVIDDHINLQPENPLRGLNGPEFGNRFVDMSEPYNNALNAQIFTTAQQLGIDLKKGVYAAVVGPNLETRAEYRYIRNIGADMVGMSTVPEVIVANHIGLKCAAVSVITDECDPDNLKPVNIAEIIEAAGKADEVLSALFEAVIKQ